MAHLAPVEGVAKLVQTGSLAGNPWNNVFYCESGNVRFTQADADYIAARLRTQFVASFASFIGKDCTIGPATCTDLTSDTGVIGNGPGSSLGTNTVVSFPANVSCCITWKIPRHYRGGHPRTYLAGIANNAALDAASWNASFVTNLTTAASGFLIAMNAGSPPAAGSIQMVAIHRVVDKVVLAAPLVDPINSAVVDTRIDSQRRRLGKDR